MKIIYSCLIISTLLTPDKGVTQVFNNSQLLVGTGSELFIQGDLTNANQLIINGDLTLTGNWISQSGQTTTANSGWVKFSGTDVQSISGTDPHIEFYNLSVDNPQQVLVEKNFELTVKQSVSLLQGDFILKDGAQLLQNHVGTNNNSGSGKLFISQTGNGNLFRYNAWSSPVTSTGSQYSVAGVLGDATDEEWYNNHPAVNFTSAYSGSDLTTPITISSAWLYKYENDTQGWRYIGQNGLLNAGLGFVMKGVSTNSATQRYVFSGKPNSGNYIIPVASGSSVLIGNPYPSALDSDKFLDDNLENLAIGSGLYFWDHYGGNSHLTSGYQGGYATYTKSGGVPATAHPTVNQSILSGTKIPQRFVAPGQGFLIRGTATEGSVEFNNAQRAFKNTGSQSVFMQAPTLTTNETSKIRLGHEDQAGFHRQILLAFNNNTTEGIDYGYDAIMLEINANDMYWLIDNKEFVIQTRPYETEVDFNLGFKSAALGNHTIMIDKLEGFTGTVILKDFETGFSYDLTKNPATIELGIGTFNNRFGVVVNPLTLSAQDFESNDMQISYSGADGFQINNPQNIFIEEINIYNLLGQLTYHYKINASQNRISVNALLQKGIYILKLSTAEKREIIKKIQIN